MILQRSAVGHLALRSGIRRAIERLRARISQWPNAILRQPNCRVVKRARNDFARDFGEADAYATNFGPEDLSAIERFSSGDGVLESFEIDELDMRKFVRMRTK